MSNDKRIEGKLEVAGIMGPIWIMGWLFAIGFAQLGMPKTLWAVLIWPYYIGQKLAG